MFFLSFKTFYTVLVYRFLKHLDQRQIQIKSLHVFVHSSNLTIFLYLLWHLHWKIVILSNLSKIFLLTLLFTLKKKVAFFKHIFLPFARKKVYFPQFSLYLGDWQEAMTFNS